MKDFKVEFPLNHGLLRDLDSHVVDVCQIYVLSTYHEASRGLGMDARSSRDLAKYVSRKRHSSRDIGQAPKCISVAREMTQQVRMLAAQTRGNEFILGTI